MATFTSSPVVSSSSAAPAAAPTVEPADHARDMGVTGAAHVLAVALGGRGMVQSRGPVVGVDAPVDVAVLVPRADLYRGLPGGPRGDRVLLGLAVAPPDGSGVRLRPLAAAGIEELWVVDPVARSLEVHREADPTGYGDSRYLGPDEPVSPLAFPDLVFRGSDFLG